MRRLIAGLCVVLVGLSAPAYAQRTTGTIIGAVTDESGAVLPGVTVTLTGAGVAGRGRYAVEKVCHGGGL